MVRLGYLKINNQKEIRQFTAVISFSENNFDGKISGLINLSE